MAFHGIASLWWLAWLAMLGCQRDQAPATDQEKASPKVEVAAALPAASPPAGLELRVEALEAGRYRLHIENRGASRVSFSSHLYLEREKDGGFETLAQQRFYVTGQCEKAAESCLSLAPGAERVPLPFSLAEGDMQCNKDARELPAAQYRVALHGCAGNAFTLVSANLPSGPH